MASCLGVGVSLFGGSVQRNRASLVRERERSCSSIGKGNGRLKSKGEEKKIKLRNDVPEKLEPFWDDGYGTMTLKDYFAAVKEFTRHRDGGPPRWFCPVASGCPLKGSPILLFLPGADGTGCGLIMHHQALGKAFEVRCLHIPVQDRTPFEGLVKLVEETIRSEHASSPNKPIYLVGDSFGGCLALAVASRNPEIDLVLILTNPATSFGRSQLQPLLPLLGAMPDALHETVLYLLSFVVGEPLKVATVNVDRKLPPMQQLEKMSLNLTSLLPYLSELVSIIPKDTFLWKLKLLESAAAYANSRLHAVKAEVLVLASGKDNMVPSRDEAQRLRRLLPNCRARYFNENGHALLLEDGIGLMTVIKCTNKYRRSRKHDIVSDYLPPSVGEYNYAFTQVTGLFHFLAGSTMFSTLGDGTIVRGLSGVPNEGPVLLVGYHNLLGIELAPLVERFIREKHVVVRGIAHPELFMGKLDSESPETSMVDWMKVFGAVPVTANNLYKLLSEKAHVLLYPGGAREALHYKGEEYKLFWPNQQEFVRMAARFGATIVPFGAVGEDDMAQLVLDYNDFMKIPVLNDSLREVNENSAKVRDVGSGEVASQVLFVPLLFPKIPGRLYYLFGKPIVTKGREEFLKDKKNANDLYNHVKSEVELSLAYLIKKRKEDPYRSLIDRTVYRAIYSSQHEVPTFDP
ncbi:acyltransferase-like protein At1g54570, chloroplastic [Cucurbita pepo subsp. pepo]|uniref:acyltransferase-like protein At1g54570, chloroplastic n=2 Tax=Cucurbita pepo subsp. pepo TaxID=3664 RepID=UPI000C9D977F|nr:acyltransferase-like protein At1g54570, chloroplastic [Cucurbita pepo subsp. pepo]